MKTALFLSLCISLATFLCGCRTIRTDLPDTQSISKPAKQALQARKEKLPSKPIPPTWTGNLGGLVKSDEWIIYQDKEQEEMKGHVSYDNGIYAFKAEYLLSDRKNSTVTAAQNVYIKQHEPQRPIYEAYADTGSYNYKTGKGFLKSTSKNPVKLIMTDTAQTLTATATQIDFNTTTQIFTLKGHVLGTYITPQGTQTLQADKVLYKPSENYLHLTGNAILSDGQRTLQADTIVYNETKNEARACGSRPLVTGTSEQGTFAIIADNVTSDAEGNKVFLEGKVQGWLVAPAINNNQLNSKF